ncbi:MAG: hypothetical protein JWP74_1044 [Marmoricola sp.]|nr:hypothetical protein [Marmoricola sp.]
MRVWGVDLSRIHLTRPEHTVGRKHRDIAYHRGAVGGGDQISGTPVRPAAEAAFGAACHASVEAGTVILDSAYHLGICSQDQLREQYETHRGWPGTARLNVTLRFAQPGSQSVAESRMRFLFYQYGLPKPQLQYVVRDGSDLIGNTDFGWPEYGVLGEFDGRVKYEKYLRPGETPADAVIREKLREDRMREATGYSFIRFTWADFYKPDQTAERTRRALSRGNRLVLPGDINSAR